MFHHPDVPSGCAGLATSKHVNEITGGSFVVGEFEGPGGEPCVIAVNKSLRESVALAIKFKAPGRIVHVNSYSGRAHPWQGEDVWLAAGQGALLRVEK